MLPLLPQDEATTAADAAACVLASCKPAGELLLVEALQRDRSPGVRRAACVGLARLGASSIQSLALALADEHPAVCQAAGEAVAKLGVHRIRAVCLTMSATEVDALRRSVDAAVEGPRAATLPTSLVALLGRVCEYVHVCVCVRAHRCA